MCSILHPKKFCSKYQHNASNVVILPAQSLSIRLVSCIYQPVTTQVLVLPPTVRVTNDRAVHPGMLRSRRPTRMTCAGKSFGSNPNPTEPIPYRKEIFSQKEPRRQDRKFIP